MKRGFVRGIRVEDAALLHRLVRDDSDGMPTCAARPITMFFAHVGLISNQLSWSKTALITRLTS